MWGVRILLPQITTNSHITTTSYKKYLANKKARCLEKIELAAQSAAINDGGDPAAGADTP
jgi:hypothetical protein